MSVYRRNLYTNPEGLNRDDYVFATYIISAHTKDYLKLSGEIAVEQTCGTWTKVPLETDELVQRHGGKVVSAFEVPDYTFEEPQEGPRTFILEVAFPVINFGNQIPMLLSTVIGNISMMGNLKLVDLVLPRSFTDAFPGPRFGITGIREFLGVKDRPLTNCMIKPCSGLAPELAGELFYQTAMGGIDIVKDDELIANASYSSVAERVAVCMAAEKRAYEETGEHTYYAVNVTDSPNRLLDNVKAALDGGVNMIMVNFLTAGIGAVRMLAEMDLKVPLMVHPDFAGVFSWAPRTGMSAHLTLGKLARLAGADIVVYPVSHGKIPIRQESYVKIAMALQDDFAGKKPSWPMPGGGTHAGMTELMVNELGKDIIIGCGAAVHAHPMGSQAGARALRQSVEAVNAGIPLREAAAKYQELGAAIEAWGIAGEKEIFGLKQ
jgi:2,3-diketo-5-methylthiopentyl-1-phosphate enolase